MEGPEARGWAAGSSVRVEAVLVRLSVVAVGVGVCGGVGYMGALKPEGWRREEEKEGHRQASEDSECECGSSDLGGGGMRVYVKGHVRSVRV